MDMDQHETNHSEAKAIFRAVAKLHEAQLVDVGDGRKVLITPRGVEVHQVKQYLDTYLKAPERRRGVARVADLDSFIDHVKRFSDGDSAICANPSPTEPKLVAVLDYHRKGADGAARFGDHRTVYDFPLSEEWKAWTQKNNHSFEQAAFAAFIEDRITDLLDPTDAGDQARELIAALDCTLASPVRLMELSRGLQVRVGHRVVNAINLQSGEAQVNYETEHATEKSGHPIKVPGAFLIGIPVFRDGAVYKIAARLRYRVQGGSINWFYSLYRHQRTFDHAFEEACLKAEDTTGLPLFVGSPES